MTANEATVLGLDTPAPARTTVHLCMSVRGALKWSKAEMRRHARHMTLSDGSRPTPEQVHDWLLDELSQGHEVVPFGPACDAFDFKTGCQGHRTEGGS